MRALLAIALLLVCSSGSAPASQATDSKSATAARDRGFASFERGDYERALEQFALAEKAFSEAGDELNVAKMIHNRAAALVELHRDEEGLAAFEQVALIAKKLDHKALIKSCAKNRAITLRKLDRMEPALDAYGEAERLFAGEGDERELAVLCVDHAVVLCNLERIDDAHPHFDRALALAREVRDRRLEAIILDRRADAWCDRRLFVEALADSARAEALFDGVDDPIEHAQIDGTAARIRLALGRAEEALALARAGEQQLLKAESIEGLARCLSTCASALRRLGRDAEAAAYLDRAIELAVRTHDGISEAQFRLQRAAVLTSLRRCTEALAEFETLAPVVAALDQKWLHAAWKMDRALALIGLDRTDEALRDVDACEAISREFGDTYTLARCSNLRGIAFFQSGRAESALAQFGEAAARVEEMMLGGVAVLGDTSSRSLREDFGDALPGALRSLKALQKSGGDGIADAYRVLQTFQGLGMAQKIAETRSLRAWRVPGEIVARTASAERALSIARRRCLEHGDEDARKELDLARRELAAVVERARALDPKAVGARHPAAARESDVRKRLGPNAALVEYAFAGDCALAFVLTHDVTNVVDLGLRSEVTRDANAVRNVLDPALRERKPVSREIASALRALGKRVVSPVLAALPRDAKLDTLFVAPSGSLCGVPLDMLLVDDVKLEQPQRDWPFLISSFAVAYVHSGTAFLEQRAAPAGETGRQLIAFADPRNASEPRERAPLVAIARDAGLGPLPFAANEALQIARFFATGEEELDALDAARDALIGGGELDAPTLRGREFVVHVRTDASERNLCAKDALSDARVLHVACHAVSDLDSPELSRLMLARGESAEDGDDGVVFLRDLGAFDLTRTELLTLSACSTNAGKLDMYEGATGLARAGLTAGARAVLSTTWEVDDAASEKLVTTFYRGWLQDKKSRVRALAEAKLRAIGAGVPISTWSAFVLWDAALDE